jgi:SMODS-associated and fused to various effectors sensor domain
VCGEIDDKASISAKTAAFLPGARLLSAELSTGPGARSVACGRHAFDLAEALTQKIRTERSEGGRLHLFIAGPGAFAFFLGQRHAALGALTLYEFDFEGMAGGSYADSLSLPIRDS